jgi:hypothetical protein
LLIRIRELFMGIKLESSPETITKIMGW